MEGAQHEGGAGPGDAPGQPRATPLVLIVEDDERNLKLVRHILSFRGLPTLEARTAAEGIELARAHLPDVVLLDLRLPDMDGRAAARLLRSDPATASIFLAAVTASAMRGDREELLGDGFDAYFAKPIDAHGFVDELVRCLSASRAPSRSSDDGAG